MSGCADVCLDHGYGYEPNNFWSSAIVTARKVYTCVECHEPISPGQRYERARGKTDNRFWTVTSCLVCAEIRDAFVCGSWIYGDLWESIRESMFPIWETKGPLDCLAKLTTLEARQKCREEYEEWQEDNRQ